MKRPTRFYSKRQENIVAKEIKGKRVANSGATTFNKGDCTTDKFLIECKTTTSERKSFTIQKNWITKNREEAFAMGKSYSAIAIDFGDGEQHYLIDSKLFKQLLEYMENDYE